MTTAARRWFLLCLAAVLFSSLAAAQSPNSSQSSAVVPRLVNFSGKAVDGGKVITGVAGATFAIYSEESGGSPLWLETQNIQADPKGNYTVQLGATKPDGLPLDLFASGEARWLGVTINGGQEQPRVLLLSVPYALKAADAETIGGLPPSAFVLAGAVNAATAQSDAAASVQSSASPLNSSDVTTSGGTVNTLPLFTTATNVQSSVLTQTGTGATAKIGINTTSPATSLDVNGAATIRGNLSLPATGVATTAAGKNSQALNFTASSYNTGTDSAVSQNFRWQAEPSNNNTPLASGTLNLLFAPDVATPAETGLRINSKGQLTFAAGQTFPGTVVRVALNAPASDFTVSGSPVTSSGTLGLAWTVAPTWAATPNAIVKRNADGDFNANEIYASSGNGGYPIWGSEGSNFTVYSGVYGESTNGTGVTGNGGKYGVYADGTTGVYGTGETGVSGSGSYYGVYGYGSSGPGVYGTGSPGQIGVVGIGSSGSAGVSGSSDTGAGVSGVSGSGPGVSATAGSGGWALDAYGNGTATGVLAGSYKGYAGWFNGNVTVEGTLSPSSENFKIDHPLDPANRYLFHASVESSESMNIYTGNVTTDTQGVATVRLPEWFEALNADFRYQLTVIGQFAQAIIAKKIENHQFQIKTSLPNVEVSWQVTGVRQDAYAKAHPLQVEQDKPENERGFYTHPELYGAPEEKGILWATAPQAMKQWQAARAKAAAAHEGTTRQ